MRYGTLSRVTGTAVLALLSVPFTALAQEQAQGHARKHMRYTLVDIGTLGGPTSGVNGGSVIANRNGAVVGGADTSVYDSGCDCYQSHAFRWKRNVLTDLGTLPGGNNSLANAINSQGAIVGGSENGLIDPVTGFPESVGTLWKNGATEDLGTLGGPFSIPNAINDSGQVAGGAANTVPDPDGFALALLGFGAIPGNQWHATLWRNGTVRDLGTLGVGLTSFAPFVNERGQVAGFSFTDTTPTVFGFPTVHGFFWDNGHMVDVGTLGGVFVMPNALNERGQVAGLSTVPGDLTNHAFLWDQRGMRDLGTLGGTQSAANSINDEGEVVGEAFPVDGHIHAFFWKHGAMTDLGTVMGCDDSNASWINSEGQVVGESFGCEGESHAFLWEKGGPAIDLNIFVPLGTDLHLTEALFISDRGEIVGKAVLPNGDGRAFVLIPRSDDGDDEADGAASATRETVAPAAQKTTGATHAALTPEATAALRARLAPRYRGFGLKLPNRVN